MEEHRPPSIEHPGSVPFGGVGGRMAMRKRFRGRGLPAASIGSLIPRGTNAILPLLVFPFHEQPLHLISPASHTTFVSTSRQDCCCAIQYSIHFTTLFRSNFASPSHCSLFTKFTSGLQHFPRPKSMIRKDGSLDERCVRGSVSGPGRITMFRSYIEPCTKFAACRWFKSAAIFSLCSIQLSMLSSLNQVLVKIARTCQYHIQFPQRFVCHIVPAARLGRCSRSCTVRDPFPRRSIRHRLFHRIPQEKAHNTRKI
ncbi:hypothetical protein F5148DRAFT_436836 [Russula earlei]|uniref:Uncharacterized protein n=1 Tax=Russula earlei TaxID=71964 RepID=A0ACC0UH43_9AGAM|nr:hypothetical protein F5148DRAFT_436836 [Russula earlei]